MFLDPQRPGLRRPYVLQRGSFAGHSVGGFVEQKTCSESKMPPNWQIKVDLVLYRESFMCSGKDVPGAWPPFRVTNLDRKNWYPIILVGQDC